jgi:hypothetical protein
VKVISLDNDWEFEYALTRKNATTGLPEPATGLAGLTCRLSAIDAGTAINAALSVAAVERGTTGIYAGVFQGDDLRMYLTPFSTIYEVFGDGLNVFTSVARFVQYPRRP